MNETFGYKFRNSETAAAHCVIRYNYELTDFQKCCLNDQGILDDFVDIDAGKTHFVVLTSKSVRSLQLNGDTQLIIYFNFLYWIRFILEICSRQWKIVFLWNFVWIKSEASQKLLGTETYQRAFGGPNREVWHFIYCICNR